MQPIWTRVVFGLVFTGILSGLCVYLYRRLIRDVTHSRALRFIGAGAVVVLGLGAVLLRGIFPRSVASPWLTGGLALWVGLVLYTVLALVVADVVRLLIRGRFQKPAQTPPTEVGAPAPAMPERRVFLARTVAASSVVMGGGLAGLGVYRAYEPARTSEYLVKLAGLPKALDGFTIVQLSDVHIGAVLREAFMNDLVERANLLKPDLFAITGDLVDDTPDGIGHIVARLSNLQSKYGTHFVSGNHDYYAGWKRWSEALTGLGINVLRNRRVEIGDGGASFDLVGVDDIGMRGGGSDYDLAKALAGRDPSRASVLLSHQPKTFTDSVEAKVGLQLSGHTHGGQTFPATGIASLMWGPRNVGLSREGDSQLVVSRGCGFVGPSMRLGSPPELVKVVLSPA